MGGIVGRCSGFSVVEVANGVGMSVGDGGAGNRGNALVSSEGDVCVGGEKTK